MKILIIHNKYGKYSGEEAVVETQINLLKSKGNSVITYFRSSEELEKITKGKLKAFFTAFCNKKSILDILSIIKKKKPDVVHIHNLYPLISPAILPKIKKTGTPIVMTVHNYRLLCPNGLFFTKGIICEKCTGLGKELNCIINNCEQNIFKTSGYALRNSWARVNKYFKNNIDAFLCLTHFQKSKLISNGFSENTCVVIPNSFNKAIKTIDYHFKNRNYIAFAGRLSPEKGIPILLEAAKNLPHIKFKLAGKMRDGYGQKLKIPNNVDLLGMLKEEEMKTFYSNARLYIHTSVCYEGFPMVFPEAMAHKLPIIAPDMAGYPEIAAPNYNGLLFQPNNPKHLIEIINSIWDNELELKRLANNAFEKVKKEYDLNSYYKKHISVYEGLLTKDEYESK